MALNQKMKLAEKALDLDSVEQLPTRNGYGEGLLAIGEQDSRVVALCADLTESTRTELFAKKFPERFIQMGVAEQNLAAVAAGLAAYGKIPFIASYAMFSPGRNWEQIRTTVGYNNVPVKIVGAHAGVSVGPDGATHQAIEDMAIMRVIANMTVVYPCDAVQAKKATMASVAVDGPVYLRFAREKTPVFTTLETPFQIGRAEVLWDASVDSPRKPDVAIVACGPLVHKALLAAAALEKEGTNVRVINNHTIKPMDVETITAAAKDAGAIVTVEEHQVQGGMGSAVAEVLAKHYPAPIEFIGVQNQFGQTGQPDELLKHFGMDVSDIVAAAKRAIARKL